MHRFFAIATVALLSFVSVPAFAAPDGHRPPPVDANTWDGAIGPQRPGGRNVPDKAGFTQAQMRKARLITARYEAETRRLESRLATAQRKLAKLERMHFVRGGQIFAAKRTVARLQAKLAALNHAYRADLARFLTPRQLRFFLSVA